MNTLWVTPAQYLGAYRIPAESIGINLNFSPVAGSIIHIYGRYNSGKTKLTVDLADIAANDGYTIIHFPSKKSVPLNQIYTIPNYYIVYTTHVHAVFECILELLSVKNKFLFIIDDISSMRLETETEFSKLRLSTYINEVSQLFRMIQQPLAITESMCFVISQMRTQISQSKQVTQFRYLNDIADIIYEIGSIHDGAKIHKTLKVISKIEGKISNVLYL